MLKRCFDRMLCSTWKYMPDREDLGGERGFVLPERLTFESNKIVFKINEAAGEIIR